MARLLLDLDGCVVEYNFPKIVKSFFGVDISKYQIYAYDLADVLGVAPIMINTMFKEQVFGKPNFIENALETLNEWKGRHEITIFTNRIKYMSTKGLVEWLVEWDIPFHGIDVLGTEDYDVHIDDSPAKLRTTNSKMKVLYTQPWNERCLDIDKMFTRVSNWKELRRLINEDI